MTRTERFQFWVIRHSPKWVIRWAVVLAFAKATIKYSDKTPDELTFAQVYDIIEEM